ACTIACGRVTRLPGETADKFLVNMHPRNWKTAGEGPEYEAAWALGADTGVGDLDAVIKANWLCNDLGMDPISMGATLAAAMELYESGVVTDKQVELPLKFGSGAALVRMIEATAYREGFGNELAEGSKRLGDKFKHPEIFMGVKGQEFPAYDPRGFQGMGIAYATCNRGACHLRAWTPAIETSGKADPHGTTGKAEWVVAEQNKSTAHDATGICLFTGAAGGTLADLAACTAAATGVPYTLDDFVKAGERTWNLERLWNLKAGFTDRDDNLPERLLKVPHQSGPAKGGAGHLDEMLPTHYRTRGWDGRGVSTREKRRGAGRGAGGARRGACYVTGAALQLHAAAEGDQHVLREAQPAAQDDAAAGSPPEQGRHRLRHHGGDGRQRSRGGADHEGRRCLAAAGGA